MEYPPLVAGQTGALRRAPDAARRLQPLTAGRASIEFTPEAGGSSRRAAGPPPSRPGAFRVEGAPPAAGRIAGRCVLEAPGLSDRHDLGRRHGVRRRSAAAMRRRGGAAGGRCRRDRLPEGAAVDQRVRDGARAGGRGARRRSACRRRSKPLTGRRGDRRRRRPPDGFGADALPSSAIASRAGQVLGRLEPRLDGGRRPRHARGGRRRSAGRASRRRARNWRAPNGCWRNGPCRRGAWRTRRAPWRSPRRGCAPREARLAQRDETLRSGGGAAAGNAFALRAPIAGRVAEVMATLGASYDEGAPLFRIVRTDRVELRGAGARADAPRARRDRRWRSRFPGVADPIAAAMPDHVHDAGVIDPTTRRAAAADRGRRIPAASCSIGQTGRPCSTRATAADAGRAEGRRADGSRAARTCSCRPAASGSRGGSSRSRRATATSSASRAGVKPGERVVTRGAYDVQLASAAKGSAGRRPRSLRRADETPHSMVDRPSLDRASALSVLLAAAGALDGAQHAGRRVSRSDGADGHDPRPKATAWRPRRWRSLVTFPIESGDQRRVGRAARALGDGGRHRRRLGRVRLGHRHLPGAPARRREAGARRRRAAAAGRAAGAGADLVDHGRDPVLRDLVGRTTIRWRCAPSPTRSSGGGCWPCRRLAGDADRRRRAAVPGHRPSRSAARQQRLAHRAARRRPRRQPEHLGRASTPKGRRSTCSRRSAASRIAGGDRRQRGRAARRAVRARPRRRGRARRARRSSAARARATASRR